MNAPVYAFLFSIKAVSSDGRKLLRTMLKRLQKKIQIESLSSVYKMKSMSDMTVKAIHDIRRPLDTEGMILVGKASTLLSTPELAKFLKETERAIDGAPQQQVFLEILLYENETRMSPDLTLPHPELHLRPELLNPAAEVWGDYIHPVLKRPLAELTKRHLGREWGEFCLQGKSLLDF